MTPVEGTPVWRKSSRSGGMGSCVEVAELGRVYVVRDSKLADRADYPILAARRSTWLGFVGDVKRGAFDR